jgi:DUF1680 family protein
MYRSRRDFLKSSAPLATQQTSYPNEASLRLKLDRPERFFVALRVPAWAGATAAVRVNGKTANATVLPGSWAEIERDWKDGDRIEFSLDMPLWLMPIDPQHQNTVALLHGPRGVVCLRTRNEDTDEGAVDGGRSNRSRATGELHPTPARSASTCSRQFRVSTTGFTMRYCPKVMNN